MSRNVTQRDRADLQQPFNLRVPGGVSSIAESGQVYDVEYLQLFRAEYVRGYGGPSQPSAGRRPVARPMHGPKVSQAEDGPDGAVEIAADGSVAALVPARRALSWQLTDGAGEGVVRERNWLSFQAGEIRVCSSCHGVNELSQTGHPEPSNPPQALRLLLTQWKEDTGNPPAPTPGPTATPAPTPVADLDACAVPLEKPRLRSRPAKGRLVIEGKAVVPKPWTRLAPAVNGMRIVVAGVLDVTVPGGTGWKTNLAGTRWRYTDRTGRRGGVRRLDVADRSVTKDGKLLVKVRLEGATAVPTAGAQDVAIGFGSASECVAAHFGGEGEPEPSCRSETGSLVCR